MSVLSVDEIWDSRTGSEELGGHAREGVTRRYTRKFRIFTSDPSDSAQLVLVAPGVPKLEGEYQSGNDNDFSTRCVDVKVTQDPADWLLWYALAEYKSKGPKATDPKRELTGLKKPKDGQSGAKDSQKESDPLQRPPRIRIRSQRWVRVVERDLFGNALENSVEEPFNPPPEKEDIMMAISITQNVATFRIADPVNLYSYVNSGAFFGFPAGCCRQVNISKEDMWEQGKFFYQVTREILCRDEPWNPLKILDVGYRILGNPLPKVIMVRNKDQTLHPATKPQPLNGRGAQAQVPAVLEFGVYPMADFAQLFPGFIPAGLPAGRKPALAPVPLPDKAPGGKVAPDDQGPQLQNKILG
jgi:hypothetical protein